MHTEPSIDHAHVLARIQAAYGVVASELCFVPVGFAAACYRLTTADGARFFVKVWPRGERARGRALRRSAALDLPAALQQRALVPQAVAPLPTRSGSLWTTAGALPLALFPWIEATAPPSPWPSTLRDHWALAFAALHRSSADLADLHLPRERFAIPVAATLPASVARVLATGREAGAGVRALRALVAPRVAEIDEQLARLRVLQRVVRRLGGQQVVCHTDMGGENLLLNGSGELHIIDWDEARLAPPEHDLHEARGEAFVQVLKVYLNAGGVPHLHSEHFAFYLLRRHLHDTLVRMQRIVAATTSEKEAVDALAGIETWGFAQWRSLDTTGAAIAATLREVCSHAVEQGR